MHGLGYGSTLHTHVDVECGIKHAATHLGGLLHAMMAAHPA